MFNKDEYFKGVSFVKIVFFIALFFGAMVLSNQVRAVSYTHLTLPTKA